GCSHSSLDNNDLWLWVPAPVRNCAPGGDDQQMKLRAFAPHPHPREVATRRRGDLSPQAGRGERECQHESVSTAADWADTAWPALAPPVAAVQVVAVAQPSAE